MTDLNLIKLAKQNDSDALFTLYNKYKVYLTKFYFSHKALFEKTNISESDYFQETFLKFLEAINSFDVEKAEKSNVSSFFTYFYTKIFKIMNASQVYIEKYGFVKYASSYDKENLDNDNYSYSNEWVDATAINIDDEIDCDQRMEALKIYMKEENDDLKKKVLNLLLDGENTNSISKSLNIKYSIIRKLIDEIKASIYTIGIDRIGICF